MGSPHVPIVSVAGSTADPPLAGQAGRAGATLGGVVPSRGRLSRPSPPRVPGRVPPAPRPHPLKSLPHPRWLLEAPAACLASPCGIHRHLKLTPKNSSPPPRTCFSLPLDADTSAWSSYRFLLLLLPPRSPLLPTPHHHLQRDCPPRWKLHPRCSLTSCPAAPALATWGAFLSGGSGSPAAPNPPPRGGRQTGLSLHTLPCCSSWGPLGTAHGAGCPPAPRPRSVSKNWLTPAW